MTPKRTSWYQIENSALEDLEVRTVLYSRIIMKSFWKEIGWVSTSKTAQIEQYKDEGSLLKADWQEPRCDGRIYINCDLGQCIYLLSRERENK